MYTGPPSKSLDYFLICAISVRQFTFGRYSMCMKAVKRLVYTIGFFYKPVCSIGQIHGLIYWIKYHVDNATTLFGWVSDQWICHIQKQNIFDPTAKVKTYGIFGASMCDTFFSNYVRLWPFILINKNYLIQQFIGMLPCHKDKILENFGILFLKFIQL